MVPVFPLSFKQVADALSVAHLVMPDRTPALQSRIKDFQRREFPPGLNTGKGRAAQYTQDHLVLLGVAFELLELGMTPDRICQLLKWTGDAIILRIRNNCALEGGSSNDNKTLIYFDPRGLSDLRNGADFAKGYPSISISDVKGLATYFRKKKGGARLAVIDLEALVSMLIFGLEEATGASSKEIIVEIVDWAIQS